jgi:hypothetical protein
MTLRTVVVAIAIASSCGTLSATPASAPHAAACVAALKAEESAMTESLKAGASVDDELLKVVRSGIAIIGTEYLAGLREAEARALLAAAERDFQALPPDSAESLQAQCLAEGDGLYSHASPLERSLITGAAQRRVKRLRAER